MEGLLDMWIADDVVIVPVRKPKRRRRSAVLKPRRAAQNATGAPADLKVFIVLPAMRALFSLLLVLSIGAVTAQRTKAGPQAPGDGTRDMTPEEYIDLWKTVALEKMKAHGIPASITLAQGLLESRNGNSDLARDANNHFGIKCTGDWDGDKAYEDDDKRHECFRKYHNASESFEDHSRFLQRSRYADLFTLRTTDYKGWAHGLKKAGYATDPRYPQKLIDLIERYELYKLDEGVDIVYATPLPGSPARPAARLDANEGEEIVVGTGRLVELFEGRIKFIRARAGDSYTAIANQQGMMPGQLARFNDVGKDAPIAEGQVIFLQPKRSKSKTTAVHVAHSGETLWDVSQKYGVKLAKLAEYNGLASDAQLQAGQQVLLRKVKR